MKISITPMAAFLLMFGSLLLLFPMLPLAALFFMWLWNAIVTYCDLTHFITYWQSLKLCFLITMLKAFLGLKLEFSKS